jgi:hypothetical protein
MKAWELLSKRGAWCQGEFGIDKDGDAVYEDYIDKAVKFCAAGALLKVYGDEKGRKMIGKARNHLIEKNSEWTMLSDWNDDKERKKHQVVALFKELDL